MSRFSADAFTFGGGGYRLLLPAMNQRAPRPRPATTGQWLHVPYGGANANVFITDGSKSHTVWAPQGGIIIVDDAAYAIFEGLYDRFGLLITPWHSGGIQARLDQLDVVPFDDGSYRGGCAWSWR